MKAVIVGAGIVGTSVAYRLALAGVEATVIDAGSVGSGTSGTTFAWLNSNRKEPLEYHRPNAAAVGEHLALAAELGGADWLHLDGAVEWDPGFGGPERLASKVERLRDRGYFAEMRSTAELRELEPALRPPPGVEKVAHYPLEGYVDVLPLLAALLDRARAAGASVRTDCRVTALARRGSRVTGVVAGGERLDADIVVCCAGRWTGELLATTGLELPMGPTAGLICVTAPRPVRLRMLLHSPDMNLRPAGAGRVMLHADDVDARLERGDQVADDAYARGDVGAHGGLVGELLERAAAVLPPLAGATVETAKVGIRSRPADGLPVVGRFEGLGSLYVACTHSGVTLGPLLGRLVARELTMEDVDVRLEPFRPQRLLMTQPMGASR